MEKEYYLIRRFGVSNGETDIIGVTNDLEFAKSQQSVFCGYEKIPFLQSNIPKKNLLKGTLHKTEQGWVVRYSDLHSLGHGWHWMDTPIHPDDESQFMGTIGQIKDWDGMEVEFEFTPWYPNTPQYAKLSKEKCPNYDLWKSYDGESSYDEFIKNQKK